MEYRICIIGHPLQRSAAGDAHEAVFAAQGLPISYERLEIPPVNFHRELTALMRDAAFLGAKIAPPYKQTALAYCQELSPAAQGIGAVNTLVRRPSGLICGDNTDVPAFVQTLRRLGAHRVRTALVIGAGGAARVALAGLRELGCARYLIGYRHPRRPTELGSQFRGIRRQMAFFPISEMTEFISWAEASNVFNSEHPLAAPGTPGSSGESRRRNGASLRSRGATISDDGIKRWDLLVNATPAGLEILQAGPLLSNRNLVRCFERILDMIPVEEPTALTKLALAADVPACTGYEMYQLQAEYSREIWLREYKRHVSAPQRGSASEDLRPPHSSKPDGTSNFPVERRSGMQIRRQQRD